MLPNLRLFVAFACVLFASSAAADEDARSSFDAAVRAAQAGNRKLACELFAESYKRAPASGALLNLGACREQDSDFVAAYNMFADAAELAERDGKPERVEIARAHLRTLAPKVAAVRVQSSAPLATNESIWIDARLSVADRTLAVKAGLHTIEVRRESTPVWRHDVSVDVGALQVVTAIVPRDAPPVATTPARPTSPAAPREQDTSSSTLRTVGFVVAGVGIANIATGSVTGILALGKKDDAGGASTAPEHNRRNDEGRSLADVSTVTFIAGGVALAGGIALVLVAPKRESRVAWSLAPTLGGTTGASLRAVF